MAVRLDWGAGVLAKRIRALLALSAVFGLACLPGTPGRAAQFPMAQVPAPYQAAVTSIVEKPDFTFESRTSPVAVRYETMENLFDHPRLAAAMWRHCQFVPPFFAVEEPGGRLTIEDGMGLRGTLTLVHRAYGQRIYLVEGRVETGRMGNPFPVGARMVVIYRYWQGPKGFESYLQTWTALDSALLGVISRPFRGYIKRRQEQFIGYINTNIAKGGLFAELDPQEFREPIAREGDPLAIREFRQVFGNGGRGRK